jgi:acetoin utilization protein AcuB
MTPQPVFVAPETPVSDAMSIMREKKIRRLPVLDVHGQLVGIVSDRDILQASPSPATSLAKWEIPELLSKLKIEAVMVRQVITIPDDTPLEEAARIMADRRIGGLPVLQGNSLVGIITESDLFKVLLELLGGRRKGVRIMLSTVGEKGTVAKITSAIYSAGGDIVGLGIREASESDDHDWVITFKVQDISRNSLVEAVKPLVKEILDVRET